MERNVGQQIVGRRFNGSGHARMSWPHIPKAVSFSSFVSPEMINHLARPVRQRAKESQAYSYWATGEDSASGSRLKKHHPKSSPHGSISGTRNPRISIQLTWNWQRQIRCLKELHCLSFCFYKHLFSEANQNLSSTLRIHVLVKQKGFQVPLLIEIPEINYFKQRGQVNNHFWSVWRAKSAH